jgi:hypothetical protein
MNHSDDFYNKVSIYTQDLVQRWKKNVLKDPYEEFSRSDDYDFFGEVTTRVKYYYALNDSVTNNELENFSNWLKCLHSVRKM